MASQAANENREQPQLPDIVERLNQDFRYDDPNTEKVIGVYLEERREAAREIVRLRKLLNSSAPPES